MLEGNNFVIVAGLAVVQAMRAARAATVTRTEAGYASEELCALQCKEAQRGILGAEVARTNYGYSVRYDSGLQNWGLLASARRGQIDGSLEAAEEFAREWVAKDPARRYAWRRAEA